MRYESPLEHGAFRRDEQNNDEDTLEDDFQPRAITIRPGAGLGVGVTRGMPQRVSYGIARLMLITNSFAWPNAINRLHPERRLISMTRAGGHNQSP